jgi:hypothetical protein
MGSHRRLINLHQLNSGKAINTFVISISAIATNSQLHKDRRQRHGGSPMGQVIRLPVLASTEPYPDASEELDPPERTLLSGIRWWVVDHRRGDDPLPRLCRIFDTSDVHDAAFSVDQLMFVVARSGRRQVAIHCPRCPGLSVDETHLLHAACLAQAGRSDLAERTLRAALLTAQGAEFALGPLEGLGELFAEAKLLFRRRRPPADDRPLPGVIEAWSPTSSSEPVH